MTNLTSAIKNTISISLFDDTNNSVDEIFKDVKESGAKVVMKDNTAECILISPTEYLQLIEELNDTKLLLLANERMKNYDPKKAIDGNDIFEKSGISNEDLEDYDVVEFE